MIFFFQAEDGIRNLVRSRGLGDVYKRQDEWEIARRVTSGQLGSIEPCMSGQEILELQELVKLSLIHI